MCREKVWRYLDKRQSGRRKRLQHIDNAISEMLSEEAMRSNTGDIGELSKLFLSLRIMILLDLGGERCTIQHEISTVRKQNRFRCLCMMLEKLEAFIVFQLRLVEPGINIGNTEIKFHLIITRQANFLSLLIIKHFQQKMSSIMRHLEWKVIIHN